MERTKTSSYIIIIFIMYFFSFYSDVPKNMEENTFLYFRLIVILRLQKLKSHWIRKDKKSWWNQKKLFFID